MSDPGNPPPYMPPSAPPSAPPQMAPSAGAPVGYAGGMPTPPGHIPCPQCGQPILPTAPMCPNCGVRLSQGRRASPKLTGLWVMLSGVGLCVIAALVFFFGCLGALSSNGRGAEIWVMISGIALVAGLLLMVVGFVWAMIQVLRK